MGHWGVKSYEVDEAFDAIDAGFERVHGAAYEAFMDDRNPLSLDQVQQTLAGPETLAAAVEALRDAAGPDLPWDDLDPTWRLAFAGVVVRHAEFGVPIPDDLRDRATAWLEAEEIDWDEATLRALRKRKELMLLQAPRTGS